MAHTALVAAMKRVHFVPSGVEVDVPEGSRLYDAVKQSSLPIASSCGADGTCGKCGLRVLSGTLSEPTEHESRVKAANRVGDSLRLSCMATIQTDLIVTADYW